MNYDEYIQNILNTRGRFECGKTYHERHHIIPKCLGGNNDKDNLIDLFAKEHFIAHKLLVDKYPDNIKLIQAYQCMAYCFNENEKRYELTPEEYEEVRKTFSMGLKEYYKDKRNHPSYGTHISEERKKHISKVNKGNKYCIGRIVSPETRKKISEANKNPSQETREKMSEARKGLFIGGKNPRAIKIIRLSDKKIYDCMKDAAEDNHINYSTFKGRMRRSNSDFMKYEDYLKLNQ